MNSYTRRRLLLFLPTLLCSTMLVFFLVRVVPGDVADALLADTQNKDAAAQLRQQFGLTDPLPVQYVRSMGRLIRGDLGTSLWSHRPVIGRLRETLPVTIELAILAMLLAIVLGVAVGSLAALYHDTGADYLLRSVSILGLSIPSFWLGTLLLILPALWWGYSPPLLYKHFWQDPVQNLHQMAFPALALGLHLSAIIARLVRSAVLEVMRDDYVRTAQAKGLGGRQVLLAHILPNSLIPVITLIGNQFAVLLGGSVIIENIFTLPGLGNDILSSINLRDYPVFQADVLVFAFMLITTNLVVDLVYSRLDPRIRYA